MIERSAGSSAVALLMLVAVFLMFEEALRMRQCTGERDKQRPEINAVVIFEGVTKTGYKTLSDLNNEY